jgi:hypothetical protein
MTTEDDATAPTSEEIKAFFSRPARAARRNPAKDFWWMSPLCPPTTLDALDAFRRLLEELRQWVADKGHHAAKNVRSSDTAKARPYGAGMQGGVPLLMESSVPTWLTESYITDLNAKSVLSSRFFPWSYPRIPAVTRLTSSDLAERLRP